MLLKPPVRISRMRKQRTVRGNTKRINRRKVSGKSIRLKGHSVLNRRKGRTSAPDVPAEIWGCWRREKALRAQQEEDGAPCRGTESRAIGVAGVRFPCRALGLLVNDGLEPGILYPAKQSIKADGEAEPPWGLQELQTFISHLT